MNTKSSLLTALLAAASLLASTAAFAIETTWQGGAVGAWDIPGNWTDGIPQTSADTANINDPTTISIPASITLKLLRVNAPATLTVASGATLAFVNSGGDVIIANSDLTIGGGGDISLSMAGTTGVDYANIKPAADATITFAARVIANGNAGLELNSTGTLVLTNPGNTFTGYARTSTANGTFAFPSAAAINSAAWLFWHSANSTFRYTGNAPTDTLTPHLVVGTGAQQDVPFIYEGAGTLTVSGDLFSTNNSHALIFDIPDPAATVRVIGNTYNNHGTLLLHNRGAGTLILSGTCSHTGASRVYAPAHRILDGDATGASNATTVDAGAFLTFTAKAIFNSRLELSGTLTLEKGATFINQNHLWNTGATVSVNPSREDILLLTLSPTNTLNGTGLTLAIPAAATASTVTIPNIVRNPGATLDITADALGTPRNKLIIGTIDGTTPNDGSLPGWLTVNGLPAAYSASLGVHADTGTSTVSIDARGPASTIPDTPDAAVTIDTPGTDGSINLAADPTTIFSLTQNHAANAANVNLAGQTLAASLIGITASGNSLTLENGTLTAPSAQTPPTGTAVFPALATQPIAWYDFSDTTSLTTDPDGRITGIANQITSRADLNAGLPVTPSGITWLPPLQATDPVSGLSVARSDGIEPPRGLASVSNAGISGNAPRTTFLVASRSAATMNNFYALYLGSDSGDNRDFAICERANRTSFSTKANDLDVPPASPAGLNVLTFISGLGGDPNAGAGYRNGTLLGTKTFAFNTADAPIFLLHRPNPRANLSGPGDIAEALIFEGTLSDTDRAAVEAYLMQKWCIATQRDDAILALHNESTAALTANTAIPDPFGATLSLAKSGPGDVILGGPLTFSGSTLIREGALTFDVPTGTTNILASPVTGSGSLVKTGPGGLIIAANGTLSGGVTVNAGTLLPGDNASLGTGPVTVTGSGTLDTANARGTYDGPSRFTNPITLSGTGPDGLGALRNSNPSTDQPNAFQTTVTLAADASVYAVRRLDIRNGTLNLGANTLTVNATDSLFGISDTTVNAAPGAAITVNSGALGLNAANLTGGSSANLITVTPGATLSLSNNIVASPWALSLSNGSRLSAAGGDTDTTANALTGPVTLAGGTATATIAQNGTAAIHGLVGGPGGLLKDGPGWLWLLNTANAYAGNTAVTQGRLYAAAPASLGTGTLAVSDTGTLIARTGPSAWSHTDIAAIANTTVFTTPVTTALGFDTAEEDFDYTGTLPHIGVEKLGPHTLTLSGNTPALGTVRVYEGTLDRTGAPDITLGTNHLYVGCGTTPDLATLTLADTSLLLDDPGLQRAGATLFIGDTTNTRGVLNVGPGALTQGRIYVGNASNSVGAVYQTGGTVTNISGSANEAAIGQTGYGYYLLAAGEFASKGQIRFGSQSGSTGIYEQRGGSFILNRGGNNGEGNIGDYYNGSFVTRRGVAHYMLSGGTFYLGHTFSLGEWESNAIDGNATLTIENDALADIASPIILANRNGAAQANINLNGGTLSATYLRKGGNATGENSHAALNFNGGTLSIPVNSAADFIQTASDLISKPTLTVYSGGAVIDTIPGATTIITEPLTAPAGLGVTSITITDPGAGYIGPPAVQLSGPCATPATAFAEIDPVTGGISAIRVTNPGTGYTAAPTVVFRGGGPLTIAAATATLGASASGGFTKLGPGALTLGGANTYTGPTVISNGTLRLTAGSESLSRATPITLAGGTLDLGGATLTNNHVLTLESGTLASGAISAQGFIKTGPGSATLDATPVSTSPEALFQGYVASLKPLLWYDPSDADTVSLDASGRITALANKGTLGAEMNAIIGATPQVANAPLLATGTLSYAASGLPMIKIDGNERGLGTAAKLGITGSAPRTVIGILTREDDNSAAYLCFGAAAQAQMWEVGDRENGSKVVIGGFSGYDLTMDPQNPAKQANVVVTALTAPNTSEAWRTGTGQNYKQFIHASGTFNTADSQFLIGNRIGASKGSNARGQIGEILVFDRLLSDDERETLMAMLQQKWLTATPPAESGADTPITFTVAQGTLRLTPGADAIASMAPAVWYDPSDTDTVTFDGNRAIGIRNKGTRTDMDAGLRSGFQGPTLASGAASYAASGLPMLTIDSNTTGLESAGNTGITGTAPRLLVAVLARPATPAAVLALVATGSGSTRGFFELSDRDTGANYGNNGDDLSISPVEPVCTARVYMHEATAPNIVTGYRSTYPYVVSKTLGGDWATPDTKLCIGYRPNGHRSDMRGQIGEVLLFDRLLTASERADLENYLAAKWTRENGSASPRYDNTVFDVAAGATLDLSGARDNITVTGAGTIANGTLGAGFVISPAGDDAIGELTLSNVTFTAGATYRLTTDGAASDRLHIDGDLSALTIVPATGAEFTSSSYVIATGAITAKPTLDGFPSKFKLLQQGPDLLLTSLGGTLLILK